MNLKKRRNKQLTHGSTFPWKVLIYTLPTIIATKTIDRDTHKYIFIWDNSSGQVLKFLALFFFFFSFISVFFFFLGAISSGCTQWLLPAWGSGVAHQWIFSIQRVSVSSLVSRFLSLGFFPSFNYSREIISSFQINCWLCKLLLCSLPGIEDASIYKR